MGKFFLSLFAQLNDYKSVTEAAVFKVSMRFNQKIKKVAVSPKEVKFFVLSILMFWEDETKYTRPLDCLG